MKTRSRKRWIVRTFGFLVAGRGRPVCSVAWIALRGSLPQLDGDSAVDRVVGRR